MNRAQALADVDLYRMDIDELRAEHDRLSDRLSLVKDLIWEREQDGGNPELRELQSDYFASR